MSSIHFSFGVRRWHTFTRLLRCQNNFLSSGFNIPQAPFSAAYACGVYQPVCACENRSWAEVVMHLLGQRTVWYEKGLSNNHSFCLPPSLIIKTTKYEKVRITTTEHSSSSGLAVIIGKQRPIFWLGSPAKREMERSFQLWFLASRRIGSHRTSV